MRVQPIKTPQQRFEESEVYSKEAFDRVQSTTESGRRVVELGEAHMANLIDKAHDQADVFVTENAEAFANYEAKKQSATMAEAELENAERDLEKAREDVRKAKVPGSY